jgi:hypothetical protein
LKKATRDEQIRDLVRGFVGSDGGASMVGPLKRDFEWLAEQLAEVLEPSS